MPLCESIVETTLLADRRTHDRLPAIGRCPRGCPRVVRHCNLCGCYAGASCGVGTLGHNSDRFQIYPRFWSATKPSGRHSAREPHEDELWRLRDLSAASASRCSSWRSAASAIGSRRAAALSRPPCESHCESDLSGSLRSKSSSPNARQQGLPHCGFGKVSKSADGVGRRRDAVRAAARACCSARSRERRRILVENDDVRPPGRRPRGRARCYNR
jgi:hypothetical protein